MRVAIPILTVIEAHTRIGFHLKEVEPNVLVFERDAFWHLVHCNIEVPEIDSEFLLWGADLADINIEGFAKELKASLEELLGTSLD